MNKSLSAQIVPLLVLIVALLGVSAYVFDLTPNTDVKTSVEALLPNQTNTDLGGISVNYPNDWTLTENGAYLFTPNDDDESAISIIQQNVAIGDYLAANSETLLAGVEVEPYCVNDVCGYVWEDSAATDATTETTVYLMPAGDEQSLIYLYTTPAHKSGEYQEILEGMIGTASIVAPPVVELPDPLELPETYTDDTFVTLHYPTDWTVAAQPLGDTGFTTASITDGTANNIALFPVTMEFVPDLFGITVPENATPAVILQSLLGGLPAESIIQPQAAVTVGEYKGVAAGINNSGTGVVIGILEVGESDALVYSVESTLEDLLLMQATAHEIISTAEFTVPGSADEGAPVDDTSEDTSAEGDDAATDDTAEDTTDEGDATTDDTSAAGDDTAEDTADEGDATTGDTSAAGDDAATDDTAEDTADESDATTGDTSAAGDDAATDDTAEDTADEGDATTGDTSAAGDDAATDDTAEDTADESDAITDDTSAAGDDAATDDTAEDTADEDDATSEDTPAVSAEPLPLGEAFYNEANGLSVAVPEGFDARGDSNFIYLTQGTDSIRYYLGTAAEIADRIGIEAPAEETPFALMTVFAAEEADGYDELSAVADNDTYAYFDATRGSSIRRFAVAQLADGQLVYVEAKSTAAKFDVFAATTVATLDTLTVGDAPAEDASDEASEETSEDDSDEASEDAGDSDTAAEDTTEADASDEASDETSEDASDEAGEDTDDSDTAAEDTTEADASDEASDETSDSATADETEDVTADALAFIDTFTNEDLGLTVEVPEGFNARGDSNYLYVDQVGTSIRFGIGTIEETAERLDLELETIPNEDVAVNLMTLFAANAEESGSYDSVTAVTVNDNGNRAYVDATRSATKRRFVVVELEDGRLLYVETKARTAEFDVMSATTMAMLESIEVAEVAE